MAGLHINDGSYFWSKFEDDILLQYYPKEGYKKVNELLPNRSKSSIEQHARKLGITYLGYNTEYFENINSKEKAYWLGFLYADGYVTSGNRWGLELSIVDIEHMKNLLNAIDCNMRIKTRCKNGNESCFFLIKNKKMYDSLVSAGVLRNKTYVLQFPSSDILDEIYYSDFIRGFFDGDGCVTFSDGAYIRPERNFKSYTALRKTVNFVCKSEVFINNIMRVLENNNIHFNLYINKNNMFTLQTRNKDEICKFYNFIYSDSTEQIRLSRKYDKMSELIRKIGGGLNAA